MNFPEQYPFADLASKAGCVHLCEFVVYEKQRMEFLFGSCGLIYLC